VSTESIVEVSWFRDLPGRVCDCPNAVQGRKKGRSNMRGRILFNTWLLFFFDLTPFLLIFLFDRTYRRRKCNKYPEIPISFFRP
jgi:hypothetical protein